MLKPKDIHEEVEALIRAASNYITVHQILARLPAAIRQQLLAERGKFGEGSGQSYTAITVVSHAAYELCEAGICEQTYLDGSGLMFEMDGDLHRLGNAPYACYRIRRTTQQGATS